jgi:hypothetical protein
MHPAAAAAAAAAAVVIIMLHRLLLQAHGRELGVAAAWQLVRAPELPQPQGAMTTCPFELL